MPKGPRLLVPVEDMPSWVRDREALLIQQENEMFRAARDSAKTDDERACWDEFIALREANLRVRTHP